MDELMKAIYKYSDGTHLIVEWENRNLILEGVVDTIYESDNGMDEYDDGYKEFYACAFKILKVRKNSSGANCTIGDLIEISVDNSPTLIRLSNGYILWDKSNNYQD